MLQGSQEVGAALPHHGGNGSGVCGKFEIPVVFVGNANSLGERPRQVPPDDSRQRFLAVAARHPGSQGGVGTKDVLQRLCGTGHGGNGGGSPLLTRTAPLGKGWEEPD